MRERTRRRHHGDRVLPRKRELVLYLGETIHTSPLMAKLGSTPPARAVVLKRLADVDRIVLKTLIEEFVAAIRAQHSAREHRVAGLGSSRRRDS